MAVQPSVGAPLLQTRDLAQINSALAVLNQAAAHADTIEAAGGDVTAYRARIQDLYTKAMVAKAGYFPGSS